MIEVRASAPGKLVVLGEYAVLEGAPALALAVNRRAHARLALRTDGQILIQAPALGLADVALRIDADGQPHWPRAQDAQRLRLVDAILRGLAAEGLLPPPGRGFELTLDSAEFFHEGHKLGLGSSAALTVALASALAVYAGRGAATANRRVWLERLLAVHRDFQDGRGSGVDVAASLVGGLIAYRLGDDGVPRFEALAWPAGVQARFVWSGASASTADFLARLAAWRDAHPVQYAAHLDTLRKLAEAAAQAAGDARGAEFLAAAAAYAEALDAFGAACGLPIFSAVHRRLRELARAAGVVYKPCGAGGGDFGVLLSAAAQPLAEAGAALERAGFRCLPLCAEERGLQLECRD
jgi:phosphomevalonate kinase